jgi:hypothetical protein
VQRTVGNAVYTLDLDGLSSELSPLSPFVDLPQVATQDDGTVADPDTLIGQTISHYRIFEGLGGEYATLD